MAANSPLHLDFAQAIREQMAARIQQDADPAGLIAPLARTAYSLGMPAPSHIRARNTKPAGSSEPDATSPLALADLVRLPLSAAPFVMPAVQRAIVRQLPDDERSILIGLVSAHIAATDTALVGQARAAAQDALGNLERICRAMETRAGDRADRSRADAGADRQRGQAWLEETGGLDSTLLGVVATEQYAIASLTRQLTGDLADTGRLAISADTFTTVHWARVAFDYHVNQLTDTLILLHGNIRAGVRAGQTSRADHLRDAEHATDRALEHYRASPTPANEQILAETALAFLHRLRDLERTVRGVAGPASPTSAG